MLKRVWMLCLALLALPAFAACPPEGQTRESLQALKVLKFTIPDAKDRTALANKLLDCLADPDPALRDGIAYEALTQWMRAGDFDAEALRGLRDKLQALLAGDDADGFRKPFAALVLSEVARTDRVAPWMTPVERATMVDQAASFVESVRDYRGFDDKEGWRHGIAHGSDWLMQLSLNPALERAQTDRILAAVAAQAVPESHAYVFGEPGRLARPLLFIAKRGLYSDAEWQTWFAALPPKLGDAAKAYNDTAWLARRHDLMAFLMSLYLEADQSEDAPIKQLKPAIVAALKQVP
ncbi:MAG: DUF2785 domain-containing protein [Luteimonas sp.]